MSKADRLGPTVRAMVKLPPEHLGTAHKLIDRLGGPRGDDWNRLLKSKIEKDLPPQVFLGEIHSMEFPAIDTPFNLKDLLDRKSMRVKGFDHRFWLVEAQCMPTVYDRVSVAEGRYVDMVNFCYDNEQLYSELPVNYDFGFDMAVLRMAQLLSCQKGGVRGVLKTDGSYNMFYAGRHLFRIFFNNTNTEWQAHSLGKPHRNFGFDSRPPVLYVLNIDIYLICVAYSYLDTEGSSNV